MSFDLHICLQLCKQVSAMFIFKTKLVISGVNKLISSVQQDFF